MSLTDDLDELEVYGKEEQSGVKLTSYSFEVSLLYLTYTYLSTLWKWMIVTERSIANSYMFSFNLPGKGKNILYLP